MRSLGVCYWYVKMPQCGCMEYGLEYITFYVQKPMASFAACFGALLVRDKLLGVPVFVRLAYRAPTHVADSFYLWLYRLHCNEHFCQIICFSNHYICVYIFSLIYQSNVKIKNHTEKILSYSYSSHPGLGWLSVFSSFPPRLPHLPRLRPRPPLQCHGCDVD